jgi:hypothetical protein
MITKTLNLRHAAPLYIILLVIGMVTGVMAQADTASDADAAAQQKAELEKRAQELRRQEAALQQKAQTLKTAEEKQSNLALREAVLDARSSLIDWRRAVEEYTLNRKLAEKGIVSPSEVDKSRETAETAELAYNEALLALERARLDILKEAAVISVVEARVYRTEGIRKAVDVRLANLSNIGKARVAYHEANDEELQKRLGVPDIRVSLRDGAIIAKPYVQRIPKLDLGEEAVLTFALLQSDLEELDVDITFFGKQETERVYLRKDSENDIPTVNSLNFDQTGQLGETIIYDLVLERLAETEKTYHLTVLNFPAELKVKFKDEGKSVSAVKFAQDVTRKPIQMEVIIPEEMAQEKLDRPVEFYALVLDDAAREELLEVKRSHVDDPIGEDVLKEGGIAHERLVFTPKGVGECELSSSDLYNEISAGEKLSIRFKVKNIGTVPLRNIRMKLELPADWEANIVPEVIRTLEMAQEEPVKIDLFPSPDLGVGDYTVRVDADCSFEGQKIAIDDKIVRIHVESKANIVGGVILLAVLLGALIGIAVFLVRLARR